MYGSSFWRVTLRPRASSRHPMEAAANPLPRLETTPPVTKINLVIPCSPQSTVLLVRSPAGCRRLSNDARLQRFECQIHYRSREVVRALRGVQAARAAFWRTVRGIPRDKRRDPNACDNAITDSDWRVTIPRV